MANLKKCANGHFYDADLSATCPYCTSESPLAAASQTTAADVPQTQSILTPQAAPPPPPQTSGKTPWIVAGAFALAALILFSKLQAATEDAQKAQQALRENEHKIKLYDEMAISCGSNQSSSYYASTPVVFLDAGGEPQQLDIYCSIKDSKGDSPTIHRYIYYCGLTDNSGKRNFQRYVDDLTSELCEWKAGYPHTYLTLSSKSKNGGLFILRFTNDADDTEFRVLVVVRNLKERT
ncbi:MAG: hypothetical protein IKO94_07600 [Selenomonadaceae bacterium]|nr:hypothetical protein [Selenomonadaceae bacterium]